MKKQTKIVAVASAAALLAIGASLTSFAATGWTEEDGTWYYYDKDGARVTDEWKKSGDNWYWLDGEEDGAMAVDKLIEDGDKTYYVDSTGCMVRNQWVKVVNEDMDDDNPAEYNYYYMQSNGKAYKNTAKKTIEGKKYCFDDDGKMLYGWVENNGGVYTRVSMADESEEWKNADYFFGGWDDGSMKTGWQLINVYNPASNDEDDENSNVDKWFNFKASGAKRKSTAADQIKEDKVGSAKYGFNHQGVMVYKWNQTDDKTAIGTTATAAKASVSGVSSNWAYFSDPESGARITKGWFKVVPEESFNKSDYDDDKAIWYYSNGDGNVTAGQIKKINNKYYAFDANGSMRSGLVLMSVDSEGKNLVRIDDIDEDELSDLKDGTYKKDGVAYDVENGYTLYYFGNDEDHDGAMKTGNVTVYGKQLRLVSNGGTGVRGAGYTGVYKKVYYKMGIKMTASSDDKYRAVADVAASTGREATIKFIDSQDDLKPTGVKKTGKYNNETIVRYDFTNATNKYKLVGTDGKIKTTAKGVKDGNDWYFWTDGNGYITYYADNKNADKTSIAWN